jgi:DNA polymerase
VKAIRVYIDYETRSEIDLKKVGAVKYAKHPSTEILCMSYKIGKNPTRLWTPPEPFPKILMTVAGDPRFLFYAHNALFEQAITKYTLPKYLIEG